MISGSSSVYPSKKLFDVEPFERLKTNLRSSSITSTSGASGPFNTLKQLSNKACALSSAKRISSTEAKGPPEDALAQTTPVVILFTAPGSKVKGPADCKNLRSAGSLPATSSVHPRGLSSIQSDSVISPSVPHPYGSVLPGNINLAGVEPPLPSSP